MMTKAGCTPYVHSRKHRGFEGHRVGLKTQCIRGFELAEWTRLELATSCVTGRFACFCVFALSIRIYTFHEYSSTLIALLLGLVEIGWAPHKCEVTCTPYVQSTFFLSISFRGLYRPVFEKLSLIIGQISSSINQNSRVAFN